MPAHRVLQLTHKRKTGIRAQIGINQLDRYAPQVIGIFGVATSQATTGSTANLRDDKFNRIATVAFFIIGGQFRRGTLHFTHHRQRILTRRALNHRKVSSHRRAFRRVKEPPFDIPAHKQRDLTGQYCNHQRQHHIACVNHPRHKPAKQPVTHPDKSQIDLSAWIIIPMILDAVGHRMRHVMGQDQKTLDQRSRQHRDNSQRDIGNQITKPAPNRRQTKKCNDCRKSCGKNWKCHPAGGIFRRLDRALATTSTPVSMFAHHNRIIDNDPQRDN